MADDVGKEQIEAASGGRWLFVSDVDGTLLGDQPALRAFRRCLDEKRDAVSFVLNSSRPCRSVLGTLREHGDLPEPDFIVGALGTEIEDGQGNPLTAYPRRFIAGWDRLKVSRLSQSDSLLPHEAEYQAPFKVSYDIEDTDEVRELAEKLAAAGLSARVIVTHGSKLDIIPADAGKGSAIEYLRERLGIAAERVVVAGDSANDLDMFVAPRRGIVVGNADEELKELDLECVYKADGAYAAGVLEGLHHWGVM